MSVNKNSKAEPQSGSVSSARRLGRLSAWAAGRVLLLPLMLLGLSAASANAARFQPPPTPPPSVAGQTLGKVSVGGSSDSFAANRKRVNRYSLPVAGAVSKLSVYLAPTSTSGQQLIKGLIYADSGGSPAALIATSNELAFNRTQSAGWYDLTFPSPVQLNAGNYWIGIITGGRDGVASFRYDSVSGSRDYNSNTYTSGPSNPFGSVTTDSDQMSIYASVTSPGHAGGGGAAAVPRGISPGSGGETWFAGLTSSQQTTWINTMKADGVKWLRIDVFSNSGSFNTEIQDAEQAGINVDAVIETDGMATVSPSTLGAVCTNQVSRYQPMGVETYEVINEPNLSSLHFTPAQYEADLQGCYTAIKAADPSARVLMGGLGDGGSTSTPGNYYADSFLAGVYAAGGKNYFDAANDHPYDYDSTMDNTPETSADCADNAWNPWMRCTSGNNGAYLNEIYQLRQTMNANGDSGKAIWMTEFGCPTGTAAGSSADCTDSTLATQITDAYRQANANPGYEYGLLGPLFIFSWIDNTTDGDFGLYQANGTPKTKTVNAFVSAP